MVLRPERADVRHAGHRDQHPAGPVVLPAGARPDHAQTHGDRFEICPPKVAAVSHPSLPMQSEIRRLMVFFGLVYFAQGLGQAGGLINQPLLNYLKANGLTSDQVAQLLGVLTIPWVIKPLYGLISDFVPFLGYRRKSYLFLMNGLAAAGFLWLTGLLTPQWIVAALVLTALGIASSDVLVDAL